MSKKPARGIIALVLAVGLTAAACSDDEDSSSNTSAPPSTEPATSVTEPATTEPEEEMGNIVETAVAAGDFETLVAAVEAAGLTETLSEGEWTVFAPSDEAFQPLVEDGTVDALLADPEGDLKNILLYHVVEGAVFAEDVVTLDGQQVETALGESLTVEVDEAGGVSLIDGQGNSVNVVTTDVEASNGVIHVIDGVLLPPS